MQTVETTVLKEARRCRLAQFCCQSRTLEIGGVRFTGIVRSVQEVQSIDRQTWIVTIVPSPTRNTTVLGKSLRIQRETLAAGA